MASASGLKRTDSITDNMSSPDASEQSRYHMKRCFAKYLEKGRRIIKVHDLMEEMEQVIKDQSDRNQILEGNLGFLLSFTQVNFFFLKINLHFISIIYVCW
jgi:sucrose synthase